MYDLTRQTDSARQEQDSPLRHCIHELFEKEVKAGPDRIAVVDDSGSLTYADLNVRANRVAHYLLSRGLATESLVGVMMERSADLIVAILGTLKAGAAYLPLDPDYPADRLRMMIEDAKPAVMLTRSTFPFESMVEGMEWICVDKLETRDGDAHDLNVPIDRNNLAYVMFTSGSTGRPKGVMIEHRSVVRLVKETDYADFGPDKVFLQLAPVTFDASTLEIWGALLNGARLAIMPPGLNSLSDLGNTIRNHGVTTLWLTAGLFHLMVDERIDELRPLKQLLAGGDVLSTSHVAKALRSLDCDLINGYGPTENTTFTCCYKIPRDQEPGRSIPIGKAIANTRVHILDERLMPVPAGETGELCVSGDGLSRGYLGRDDLTAEKFVRSEHSDLSGIRLYRTGDLVRALSDGNIEFLGRVDNQIKIRGFRVELEEIEAAITSHGTVKQSAVAARQIATGDKQLVAFVVTNAADACGAVSGIREHLQKSLPDFMVPSFIFAVDELPLTSNGKVDRAALLETIPSASDRHLTTVAPEGELERQIADILAEILNTGTIGAEDNFFDLGANSLQLASLHNRLQLELGKELRITSLFQNPTVRMLAKSFVENAVGKALGVANSLERGEKQRAAYERRKAVQARRISS